MTGRRCADREPSNRVVVGSVREPDFIIELARRLGLPGFDSDDAGYLDEMLRHSLGIGIEALRAAPGAGWVDGETQYRKYAREQTPADRVLYEDAETKARQEKAGLWRDPHPVPPWEWRKR